MDYRSVGVRCGCSVMRPSVVWCGRHWGYPTRTVDVVVVGAYVVRYVHGAGEVVVGGHAPEDGGHFCGATESQILCCAVEAATIAVVEPDATQVEGHVDFFSSVGIVAENPQLVISAGYTFGPDVRNDDVGLNLVIIATVDHHLVLSVEELHAAVSLRVREIHNRVG